MLEVRFAEVKRSALSQIGVSWFVGSDAGKFDGVIGGDASRTPDTSDLDGDGNKVEPVNKLGSIVGSFGIVSRAFRAFGENFNVTLDALERKGAVTTLAEPTLIALSGETASFLAGGEFPVPVVQNGGGGGGGGGNGGTAFTVEWKPFGVSLAFTPTVLADGVINMVVAPEVSSIDPSASIVINNLTIPGIQTRRAKTVVEIRDGESFAMAGLLRRDFQDTIRQVPLLGSVPIIGALFRSPGFQHEETELVIIVTPRLVRPVPAGSLKVPTDRVGPPNEADLLLNGRTDTGVPPPSAPFVMPPPPPAPGPVVGSTQSPRGSAGFEKDYGHVL
jgi:pilus assembly protein CpaC